MHNHHIRAMAEAIASHFWRLGLPADLEDIKSILRAYWEDYAVHVWSTDDVFYQAQQSGWPMCEADAREVLADFEAEANSESGLTWDGLAQAVNAWCENIRWAELNREQMRAFEGCFVVLSPYGDRVHLKDSTLWDACRAAQKLEGGGEVWAVDRDALSTLEPQAFGHRLMIMEACYEQSRDQK